MVDESDELMQGTGDSMVPSDMFRATRESRVRSSLAFLPRWKQRVAVVDFSQRESDGWIGL